MSNSIKNEGVLNYIGSVGAVSGGGASRGSVSAGASGNWFQAMAKAWGDTLDSKAAEIIQLSDALGQGANNPSQVALLTAAAHEMAFLSQSAATSQNSAAQAIENIAKRN